MKTPNISSWFSLGGVLLSSGKIESILASTLVLEPVIDPLISDAATNGFSAEKAIDALASVAVKGQLPGQVEAASNLIKIAGTVLQDPKNGPVLVAALKTIFGVPGAKTLKASALVHETLKVYDPMRGFPDHPGEGDGAGMGAAGGMPPGTGN